MPDPFEALRTAPTPIDPEPAFAVRLRARVLRALQSGQGDQRMTLQTQADNANTLQQGDISYLALWVRDVPKADRFYASVLGWRYAEAPGPAENRQIEGQSTALGLTGLQPAAEFHRQLGVPVAETLEPTGYVVFVVNDLDAALASVRSSGGYTSEPMQQPWGRTAACNDGQGLLFSLHQSPPGLPAPRPPARGARDGDLAFVVFETADSARARTFFGSVLGLRFMPGRSPDDWNLADVLPMSALSGGHGRPAVVPLFRVDDVTAAVARVRAAGGTATDAANEGYAIRSVCVDDQGTRFMLAQF